MSRWRDVLSVVLCLAAVRAPDTDLTVETTAVRATDSPALQLTGWTSAAFRSFRLDVDPHPLLDFYSMRIRNDASDPFGELTILSFFSIRGNVGIGTPSAESNFEAQAGENTDADLVLDADDGDDTADTWVIRSDASDNNFYIKNHLTDLVAVRSGGNVGIGVTDPDAKLEINGQIKITGGGQGPDERRERPGHLGDTQRGRRLDGWYERRSCHHECGLGRDRDEFLPGQAPRPEFRQRSDPAARERKPNGSRVANPRRRLGQFDPLQRGKRRGSHSPDHREQRRHRPRTFRGARLRRGHDHASRTDQDGKQHRRRHPPARRLDRDRLGHRGEHRFPQRRFDHARDRTDRPERSRFRQHGGVERSSFSWTHIVGGEENRILIVGVHEGQSNGSPAGRQVIEVTYAGQRLTMIADISDTEHEQTTSMWFLVEPPPGRANVEVTASENEMMAGGSAFFSGVDTENLIRGSATARHVEHFEETGTVTVASAVGDLVVDTLGSIDSIAVGGGQTELWDIQPAGRTAASGGSFKAGAAGNVAMSWGVDVDGGVGEAWTAIAISLIPRTIPGNPTGTHTLAERMRIDGSGRVGIGRTPTTNALEINGSASKATSGDWVANSDRRIKTSIKPIAGAIAAIERLRPVRFRYTQEYRDQHRSIEDRDYRSFIAQEFAEVFPESVQMDGSGLLQIDTFPVRPTLVVAMQDLLRIHRQQEETIAWQDETIERQGKELETILRRLERLERPGGR